MNNPAFIAYFDDYLDILYHEIDGFKDENLLWEVKPGVSNSAGNLTLHLIGNLNHFIGGALGQTGYQRKRDEEFSLNNVPKSELLEKLVATKYMASSALAQIADLKQPYPSGYFKDEGTIEYMLLRLLSHLAYHTGQVNYLGRILSPH